MEGKWAQVPWPQGSLCSRIPLANLESALEDRMWTGWSFSLRGGEVMLFS